jgi:hypothetical protein
MHLRFLESPRSNQDEKLNARFAIELDIEVDSEEKLTPVFSCALARS